MMLKQFVKTIKTSAVTLAVAATLPALAAENVSWSWNCDSVDNQNPQIVIKTSGNTIASCTIDADAQYQFETVTGTSGVKDNETFVKMTPSGTSYGSSYKFWHYATIPFSADVTNTEFDAYTLSFDYAPTRNKDNTNAGSSFGLSLRDASADAIVTFYGNSNVDFGIYKGSTISDDTLLSEKMTQITCIPGQTADAKTALNWFHVEITASTTEGTRISVSTNGTAIVNNAVLSSTVASPSSLDILTGYYSKKNYACIDSITFTGTTIYKTKYTKSVDCTFDNDADQSILTNGFVTSTLLGTTEKINDSVNWSVVTGEASPKSGEKFAQISLVNNNNLTGQAGLIVEMPKVVTKATEYVLEFDALVMSGYSVADTNGFAIVGKNGTLATMWNGYSASKLYKGDSEEDPLASEIAVTSYNDNAPASTQCIWHHCIVRGDAENGVRFSMTRKDTREEIVQNVRLGDFDNVTKIALCASIHGQRTIYACIDNIEAWTYKKSGLSIFIQ